MRNMTDEENRKLSDISEALAQLRSRWSDPSRDLAEYVREGEVPSVNQDLRQDNPALLTELERLEGEHARIRSLLMGAQEAGEGQLAALEERVARLRNDFASLTRP
jgi:hypothetical protein